MRTFPTEFADLLSAKGLRVLSGPGALSDENRFVAATGLLDPRQAQGALALIDRTLRDVLAEMNDPIPPWTISGMQDNYGELLPKTVRVRTAMLESRRSKAWQRAHDIGLLGVLKSSSFHAFAQALSGYSLRKGWGTQVLCYLPGDYSGPHNDHHPEDADARGGYVDVHLTLCTKGVSQQHLIYAKAGHFTESTSVATVGGITCYRLPFWHFTTPLLAKRGAHQTARRWVLLGTFLDAKQTP
jgi:hypothetical protein